MIIKKKITGTKTTLIFFGGTAGTGLSPRLSLFPCFVWKIQNCFVILHARNEYKTAMTTKEGTKRNMILHMLEYKRAMRECIILKK